MNTLSIPQQETRCRIIQKSKKYPKTCPKSGKIYGRIPIFVGLCFKVCCWVNVLSTLTNLLRKTPSSHTHTNTPACGKKKKKLFLQSPFPAKKVLINERRAGGRGRQTGKRKEEMWKWIGQKIRSAGGKWKAVEKEVEGRRRSRIHYLGSGEIEYKWSRKYGESFGWCLARTRSGKIDLQAGHEILFGSLQHVSPLASLCLAFWICVTAFFLSQWKHTFMQDMIRHRCVATQ